LQIDDQFEFRRQRDWQVGRLLALEDAADVASSATELVGEIRPIG
jgi:hypothetical protein